MVRQAWGAGAARDDRQRLGLSQPRLPRSVFERGIRHKRTRPYTPRTNGKAERFIQTSLREWAYAQPFTTSGERAAAMQPWIDIYNGTRPHSALGTKSPLRWIAARNIETTTPLAKSDPEPRFVGAGAVKPRTATAEGGLGLTALLPTQAQSETGGDNLLGNDT